MSQIHYAYTIRNMIDDGKIMGYEKIGKPHLLLNILKHIYYLGLNGNIQSRNRLVTYDELRINRKRSRDSHPLPLSSGKLMWITVGVFGIKAYML